VRRPRHDVYGNGLGCQDPSDVIIVSEHIYPGDAPPFAGYIRVSAGRIAETAEGTPPKHMSGSRIIDVGHNAVIPGLIDLHIHGFFGFDVASPDPEEIASMARHLAKTGVTSFLPTVGAMPVDLTEQVIACVSRLTSTRRDYAVDDAKPCKALGGAQILGLHLEGPFLNPDKRGAMAQAHLLEPSVELMARWMELGEGAIKHVTVAPELPGAQELISFLAGEGVCVAAGHTMADYQQAIDAVGWGVTAATHVYNAMRGFHHREPGVVGAVLTDPRIWAEVICDGVHVHPAAVLVVVACKGPDRIYLVSDALAPAGLPPGCYSSLGHEITVHRQGRAYLADGTLAGSTATLLDGVKNLIRWTRRSLEDIIPMATANPATVAGVSECKGSLTPGKDADLVVLDKEFDVVFTMVGGNIVEVANQKD
jgi:N-acetylglucosamine-6-phosphate deacetylase